MSLACDLCGNERTGTEMLCFDQRQRPKPREVWRIARVCPACREEKLMPVLRRLFGGEGINLADPEGDDERDLPAEPGSAFRSFEHPNTGTVHVARTVRSGPGTLYEARCVGLCGISARTEPEERHEPLDGQRESVCQRCEDADWAGRVTEGVAP